MCMMLSLIRRIRCPDRLVGPSVSWSPAPCGKALLNTWAGCKIGRKWSPGSECVWHPGCTFGGAQRSLWTPEGPRRARKTENTRAQVSLDKSPKEGRSLSAAQKVKEAGRDFTYLIVVIVGISVTGGLFYVIFKELFSSSSPSKIYGDALEKCRAHPENIYSFLKIKGHLICCLIFAMKLKEDYSPVLLFGKKVIGFFGEPIKGYGEATRRGRRQLVSHIDYVKDGLKYMRLKFYIEGSEKGKQGTVHLEVKENPESGKYEYRYIFVDIDVYPRRTIIIEDNR